MAAYALTVAGHSWTATIDDVARIAAVEVVRQAWNAALPDSAEAPREDHDDYCADNAEYLMFVLGRWVASNPEPTLADLQATLERALASYAGENPPAAIVDAGPPSVAALKAYAAQKRWEKEVGGIVINGVPVPTDDRAKLLLLGAAQSMPDGSSSNLVIGGVDYGSFTKAQFQAINAAVVAHVQATFPLLASVLTAIEAGTITDKAGVDAAFA